MSNFVQDYLAGNASLEDIDDYISAWHDGDSKKELHEFLGLSFDEFALFVQNQDLLSSIIQKNHKKVIEKVKPKNHIIHTQHRASKI